MISSIPQPGAHTDQKQCSYLALTTLIKMLQQQDYRHFYCKAVMAKPYHEAELQNIVLESCKLQAEEQSRSWN